MNPTQKAMASVLRDFKEAHGLSSDYPGLDTESARHAWVWILEEATERLKELDPTLDVVKFKRACGYRPGGE